MTTHSGLEIWVNKLLDGDLSIEEEEQLAQLLSKDDGEARRTYFKLVDVQLELSHRAQLEHLSPERKCQLPPLTDTLADYEQSSSAQLETRARSYRWQAAALVAIACGLLTLVVVLRPGEPPSNLPQVAIVSPPAVVDEQSINPSEAESQTAYVAGIGAVSSETRWANNGGPREFLLRINEGDTLELQDGLVSVEYFSGPSVILHGPCRFQVTGPNSGRLERGKVTGQVLQGEFTLTTPTAQVVDLGTEFGASVDDDQNTDVYVFDGKVRLAAANHQGAVLEHAVLLTDGMAARATAQGSLDTDVQINQSRFARSVPLPPSVIEVGRLSLVDVMNGYEDGSYRLAGGIEANTGNPYQQASFATQLAHPQSRRSVYHVTGWHPAVDGVFIPSSNGRDVQSDSTGGVVDLPPGSAVTWGPIWSRRRIDDTDNVVFHKEFWGWRSAQKVLSRMKNCEWGMIGVHSNVGITFDLHAIQELYGQRPTAFQTIVANLDSSHVDGPGIARRRTADFRLFVDGKLRRSRLNFGRSDGDMVIATSLAPTARFLTIATNDAGDYFCDQVVLIDPSFELAPLENDESHSDLL